MGGTIARLQQEHKEWLAHNFPQQQPWDPFLGMVEEVGELAHALLKYKQAIRGHKDMDPDKFKDEVVDSLGDLFIYMMSYCNSNNLDLEYIITKVWDKVKYRDWKADPVTGGET